MGISASWGFQEVRRDLLIVWRLAFGGFFGCWYIKYLVGYWNDLGISLSLPSFLFTLKEGRKSTFKSGSLIFFFFFFWAHGTSQKKTKNRDAFEVVY